jgi:hypothetical protein
VLVEVSVSLRNILEIDEHKQVRKHGPSRSSDSEGTSTGMLSTRKCVPCSVSAIEARLGAALASALMQLAELARFFGPLFSVPIKRCSGEGPQWQQLTSTSVRMQIE